MNIIEESFQRLFPEKEFKYNTKLEYNRRLSDFNANIKFNYDRISVHLNLQWKDIDKEIKIGLIQTLLLKVFKKRVSTQNVDLYNNFVKNIPLMIEKNKTDPHLEKSFHRVNGQFFMSMIDLPNLTWGTNSKSKLASYNFHNDTVTVSTIFKDARAEILDYLMYHELLHKQQKFKHKNGRSYYHTKEFKASESLYPEQKLIEKEIEGIIRINRKKRSFWDKF